MLHRILIFSSNEMQWSKPAPDALRRAGAVEIFTDMAKLPGLVNARAV